MVNENIENSTGLRRRADLPLRQKPLLLTRYNRSRIGVGYRRVGRNRRTNSKGRQEFRVTAKQACSQGLSVLVRPLVLVHKKP